MEKLNSAKGAPPLYLQISEILRNKILTKEYAFDTIIPSETELQGMYQVSRITARQAIQELEKDGLVSVRDTYEFFATASSADRQMKIYGNLFHEIFNEYCRDEVIGNVIGWIINRI